MADLTTLSNQLDAKKGTCRAIIETPKGCRNKFDYDPESNLFMLGGLLLNRGQTAQEQVPWVGYLPVLGTLFRSASYQKNETDLAIIVTPRIVRPARPGDPIKSPLDNRLPGNDVDLFLMGKQEVNATERRAAAGRNGKFVGHMLDLPKEGSYAVTVKN